MLDYYLLVHMPYALKTTIPPLQKVADSALKQNF